MILSKDYRQEKFFKFILTTKSLILILISKIYYSSVKFSKLLSMNWIAFDISATYLISASVASLLPNKIFSLMDILKRIGSYITNPICLLNINIS